MRSGRRAATLRALLGGLGVLCATAGPASAMEIRTWDLAVHESPSVFFPVTSTPVDSSWVQPIQGFNATQFTTDVATPAEEGMDFMLSVVGSFSDGAMATLHDFTFPEALWDVDIFGGSQWDVNLGVSANGSGIPNESATLDLTGNLIERSGQPGVFDVSFNPFTVYWEVNNGSVSDTGSFLFQLSTFQQVVTPLQTNPGVAGLDCDAPDSTVYYPGDATNSATPGLDPSGNFTLYGLACPTGMATAIIDGVDEEDIFAVQLTGNLLNVPEPGTLLLMMGGLAGLGLQGRRRTA